MPHGLSPNRVRRLSPSRCNCFGRVRVADSCSISPAIPPSLGWVVKRAVQDGELVVKAGVKAGWWRKDCGPDNEAMEAIGNGGK